MQTGLVQVYTGDGKGKTTAALGLALRAVGAGLRVFIGQFAKGMHYSELDALPMLGDQVTCRQFGRRMFITGEPRPEDMEAARAGLAEARAALCSGEYDVVILDEGNIAVYLGLLSVVDLLAAIEERAPGVEVIITGRRAHPGIMEKADLVTEMREVKHYYKTGVGARKGIET